MNRTLLQIALSRTIGLACFALLGVCSGPTSSLAQSTDKRPSLEQISSLTAEEIAQRKGYQSGDLITQSDVTTVLKSLAAAGWKPADAKEIVSLALPDDDALVRILGTNQGNRFMRQTASVELIYDRLDRVCRVYGGQRMITDLAKLPDGAKLTHLKRPYGVPGFLDLLPKTASGKRRSIKDYEKPTGRIYTEEQLLKRLEASYQNEGSKPTGK